MTISKALWEKIEEKMRQGWVSIKMDYKGHGLHICRVKLSENKTALAVYIDGVINQSWGGIDSGIVEAPDNTPVIVKDVWKKSSKARYSPKQIKSLEKVYGKRKAKQQYPDLHARWEFFVPTFSKASVLCRQFKNLEGLTLLDTEYVEGGINEPS
ncbi:hypothetical protein [Photobacterium sanguinicancri]|uniref:hypothetical protein n=1 Tax=Photobacterium sanguinicancri TaxID=875932 RepID=UPI0026E3AFAA|nr:hypothetical protein [Photobacterium sanguinicancri]MDO6497350.1 hypothetical protein [Photobacterium sanguinicancri]